MWIASVYSIIAQFPISLYGGKHYIKTVGIPVKKIVISVLLLLPCIYVVYVIYVLYCAPHFVV